MNHPFVGDGIRCKECWRTREHENHAVHVSLHDRSADPDYPSGIATATKEETIPTYGPDGKENGSRTRVVDTVKYTKPIPECQGHPCVKCGNPWKHAYACFNKPGVTALCSQCAQPDLQQSAAIINRHENIKQIKQEANQQLTPQDIIYRKQVTHDNVYNMIHDSTGKRLPNWQETVEELLRGKQKIIEQNRVDMEVIRSIRAEAQVDEMQGLTYEQRKELEKAARQNKKPRKARVAKEKLPDTESGWNDTLKRIMADTKAKNPLMSPEEIRARAEAKAKRIFDEDDDD